MQGIQFSQFYLPGYRLLPSEWSVSLKQGYMVLKHTQAAPLIAGTAGLVFHPDGLGDPGVINDEVDLTEMRVIVKTSSSTSHMASRRSIYKVECISPYTRRTAISRP